MTTGFHACSSGTEIMTKRIMKMKTSYKIFRGIILCMGILAAGIGAMNAMTKIKTPPETKEMEEKAIAVEVMTAAPEDIQISLSGYGTLTPLNTVDISSEISGLVKEIHPRLKTGEVISKGEILFKLDEDDYKTALSSYSSRCKALKANVLLAKKEYLRVKKLYEKRQIGTLKDVEDAQSSLNTLKDNLAQVEKLLKDTEKNLKRCTVKALFNARVKYTALEKGSFVAAGSRLLTLADDAILEMAVPVDTGQALTALDFENKGKPGEDLSWFGNLKNTSCRVVWSESGQKISANGYLHRIITYDPTARTVLLAVRINAGEQSAAGNFPLVDGMFCEVIIPGKTMEDVIRVPDKAVSFDGKLRLTSGGRLKTILVEVVWRQNDFALISSGLTRGDKIITTPLASPLENTLLVVSDARMPAQNEVKTP